MSGRFKDRVDIAMKADQKERAAEFGVKYLEVTILKKSLYPPIN